MLIFNMLLSVCAGLLLACGPTNVVPTSPDHPANPGAKVGQEAPESKTLRIGTEPVNTEDMGDGDMSGHDMSGHDMSGHDMSGHDMSGHDMSGHDMSGHDSTTSSNAVANEMSAYERAKPVFAKYCLHCHTAKAKAGTHVAMDAYPFTGHHSDEIAASIREVLGLTGKKPTMPKDYPGSVKGEELALIVAWLDAFESSHPTHGKDPAKEGAGHKH